MHLILEREKAQVTFLSPESRLSFSTFRFRLKASLKATELLRESFRQRLNLLPTSQPPSSFSRSHCSISLFARLAIVTALGTLPLSTETV